MNSMYTNYLRYLGQALLFSSLAIYTNAYAETVKIPVSQQGSAELRAQLPKTGELKATLKQKFGEPLTVRGPFGDPPISTWTYSDFTVYFEHEHVVHAVVNPKKR